MALRQFSPIEIAGAAKALSAPAPSRELIARVSQITHASGALESLAVKRREVHTHAHAA